MKIYYISVLKHEDCLCPSSAWLVEWTKDICFFCCILHKIQTGFSQNVERQFETLHCLGPVNVGTTVLVLDSWRYLIICGACGFVVNMSALLLYYTLVEQCTVIWFLWSQRVKLSQECYHHYGENCCAQKHSAVGEECLELYVNHYTRQQNFTFLLAHEGKYQILIELLMQNSNI